MMSLGIVANKQKDFETIAKMFNVRAVRVVCLDDSRIKGQHRIHDWTSAWRKARKNGAAKAGGEAKADKSEQEFWERFEKIKDRWHLGETSKSLMKEAGIGHHDTVRANLGYTRWEWRKLSDNQRERILKRKANAKR